MDYNHVVRDFADRTLVNLEHIETAVKGDKDAELYEFTQLVNSMLGLLVLPRERYLNNIPQTPVSQLIKEGWPIPKMHGTPPRAPDLRKLIGCMRDGIGHFNIEFISDGDGVLSGLEIWNCKPDGKGGFVKEKGHRVKPWRAVFSKEQLRSIACKFIEVLKEKIE